MSINIKQNISSFIFNITMPLLLSGIVTIIIYPISPFYNSLDKTINLSPYVFMIIWPILYLLIGLSNFIFITNNKSKLDIKYYYLTWINLFINLLWFVLFFGFKTVGVPIFVLVLLIILESIKYYGYIKSNKISAYLLIPYLLFLMFALILNINIYLLN